MGVQGKKAAAGRQNQDHSPTAHIHRYKEICHKKTHLKVDPKMETGITIIIYLQPGMDTDLAAFREDLEGPQVMHTKTRKTIVITVPDTGHQVRRQAASRIKTIVHITHVKTGISTDIQAGDGPQSRYRQGAATIPGRPHIEPIIPRPDPHIDLYHRIIAEPDAPGSDIDITGSPEVDI